MQLQPKRPPGRIDRKAGAFASEIVRLRAEGYTYEAIRGALADVGVALSACALRREMRRHLSRSATAVREPRPSSPWLGAWPSYLQHGPRSSQSSHASHTSHASHASHAKAFHAPSSTGTTGRDVAEAFFSAHPDNPLFTAQETA